MICAACASATGQTRAGANGTGDDVDYAVSAHEAVDLFVLDTQHIWLLAADHGVGKQSLFKTSDGGASWKYSTAPKDFKQLYFLNAMEGWALQYSVSNTKPASISYRLLRTKDGGNTWRHISPQPFVSGPADGTPILVGFAFADDQHGWFVGGAPDNIAWVLQTSNGGKTFERLEKPSTFFLACLGVVARGREVWIYGEGGLLHSRDLGSTWSGMVPGEFTDSKELVTFSSGVVLKDGSGWLVGSSPQAEAVVLGTKNFGQNWQVYLRLENPRRFDLITSWDRDHACAVASPNWLFCTADGGSTWRKRQRLPAPLGDQANFFQQVIILKSGKGWAVRGGGFLYKTDDGGQNWKGIDPIRQLAYNGLANRGRPVGITGR
jgi:photosystem II stability/assembly factor-like uncharacterized protein